MPLDTLKSTIARVLEVDPSELSPESRMGETPNWDSLRQVVLMTEVEQAFSVRLTFEEMTDAISVEKIAGLLQSRGVLLT